MPARPLTKAEKITQLKAGCFTSVIILALMIFFIAKCTGPDDKPKASLSVAEAYERCKPLIDDKLARPATASYGLGSMTVANMGSHDVFYDKVSAENAFGAQIEFQASCRIEHGQAVDAGVTPL